MKAFVAVRREGEELIGRHNLDATCLRPWYVLGPGHRWPCVLPPLFAVVRLFSTTRATARRLGLVTREQMIQSLVRAVETPARGVRVVEVPQIQSAAALRVD